MRRVQLQPIDQMKTATLPRPATLNGTCATDQHKERALYPQPPIRIAGGKPADMVVLGDAPVTFRQHARFYLRQSAISGIGNVVARILGVLFSVVLARAYGPQNFGLVRYAVSVAGLAAIVVGPLPTMLSRYLARYRNDPEEVDRYFTNALLLIVLTLLLTLLGTGWYLRGERTGVILGTLTVVCGLAAFNTYTELSRGLDNIQRMALYYVVANLAQLIAIIICVWGLNIRTVSVALAIDGLSTIVPIALFELRAPSPVRWRPHAITRATARQLSRFSVPLVIAHASYTIWLNLDLLLAEQRLGAASAGIYSAAKTAVLVFLFVPYAVTTVALRYFARGSPRDARRSLLLSLLASGVVSEALLLGYWALSTPLVHIVFGRRYAGAADPLVILAAGMTFYTLYLVFETWVVAKGYPWLHAVAMVLTMFVSTGAELALLPRWGLPGVALGFTLGIASGTLVLGALCCFLLVHESHASGFDMSAS
jgi:O-antigen/teichoic acid export membrane protein